MRTDPRTFDSFPFPPRDLPTKNITGKRFEAFDPICDESLAEGLAGEDTEGEESGEKVDIRETEPAADFLSPTLVIVRLSSIRRVAS